MNIFHKIAFKGLVRSKTRTIVTIVGVALSAALITAVATFGVSLLSYMIHGAEARYGSWQAGFPAVDRTFAAQTEQDDRVKSVTTVENVGYAWLDGSQNTDKPYVFIAGLDESEKAALSVELLSGRMPANSQEVVIPMHLSANGGVSYQIGDTLTLSIGKRQAGGVTLGQQDAYQPGETMLPEITKTYTVVGICSRPGFESQTAPGYTLITQADGDTDTVGVYVTLAHPFDIQNYVEESGQDYILNDQVLRFMGLSEDKLFNSLLYAVGGVLIGLIMLGSVFLIYNAFNISLNERTQQFGMLMSVGATARQLRQSVLFEGVCIGMVGIPLGIGIGIPAIALVLRLVAQNFSNVLYDNVPLMLVISPVALIGAVIVSLVTILISAYIPARRAAAMPIMNCIRQTNMIKVTPAKMRTNRLTSRLFGLPGMLAMKNFKRNQRRYRSIVLSLTLSVVLFVSASNFSTYLNRMGEDNTVAIDGDILFSSETMTEKQFMAVSDALLAVDGVTRGVRQADGIYRLHSEDFPTDFAENAGKDFSLTVQFIDDAVYQNFLAEQGLTDTGVQGVMVATDANSHQVLFAGQTMECVVTGNAQGADVRLKTVFTSTYPLDPLPEKTMGDGVGFIAVLPWSMRGNFTPLGTPEAFGITLWSDTPGQSAQAMQSIINSAGLTGDYTFYNFNALLDQNRNMVFIINLFTAVFTGMITLIAIANVFNTIATNVKMRRREFAMLRSVGMGDKDFGRMLRWECLLYGLYTLLIGVPLSALASAAIYQAIDAGGGTVAYTFPWQSLGMSILGVFIIIFITMLYAAGRVRRENILDALRDDML